MDQYEQLMDQYEKLVANFIEDYESQFLDRYPRDIRTSTVNAFLEKYSNTIWHTILIRIKVVDNSSKKFKDKKIGALAYIEQVYEQLKRCSKLQL